MTALTYITCLVAACWTLLCVWMVATMRRDQ